MHTVLHTTPTRGSKAPLAMLFNTEGHIYLLRGMSHHSNAGCRPGLIPHTTVVSCKTINPIAQHPFPACSSPKCSISSRSSPWPASPHKRVVSTNFVLNEQALRSLNRRLDETKLFYHSSPEKISSISGVFFQVNVVDRSVVHTEPFDGRLISLIA